MTAVLTTWLLLLTLATAVNLQLCFAVMRRLRSAGPTGHAEPAIPAGLSPVVGTRLPAFDSSDRRGVPVRSSDWASGRHQLVLLTPTCKACVALLDTLRADPAAVAGAALRSFLVIADEDATGLDQLVADLEPYGRVALLSLEDPPVTALGRVEVFPTVLDLWDGEITRVGHRLPITAGR